MVDGRGRQMQILSQYWEKWYGVAKWREKKNLVEYAKRM